MAKGITGGKRRRKKKQGERNEKSESPDIHNAVADDKGYSDSSSSVLSEDLAQYMWDTLSAKGQPQLDPKEERSFSFASQEDCKSDTCISL